MDPSNALPLATRLWFAWLCFFQVLFDARFAARVWGVRTESALPAQAPTAALPSSTAPGTSPGASPSTGAFVGSTTVTGPGPSLDAPPPAAPPAASRPVTAAAPSPAASPAVIAPGPSASPDSPSTNAAAALQLLALLQREGRLIDFLQQEIAGYGDADVGVAARVVHEGCRRALREHLRVEPVRAEEEGRRVTLDAGFDADAVKLVGDVKGEPPYRGVLRHRGWRAVKLELPERIGQHDGRVLAPAEVELG